MKFKIGDRVRVVNFNGDVEHSIVGLVFTVSVVQEHFCCADGSGSYREDELELFENGIERAIKRLR